MSQLMVCVRDWLNILNDWLIQSTLFHSTAFRFRWFESHYDGGITFWINIKLIVYWRCTVFRSLQLPPGSVCIHGTHCQHTFVAWRTVPLHLDDYLRLICFLITSVYSALAVSAIMRYINRRFTYLLTYSLGDLQRQCGSDRGPGMYLYSRCKRPTEERCRSTPRRR